jgi:iron complex outermembrane recepter protein
MLCTAMGCFLAAISGSAIAKGDTVAFDIDSPSLSRALLVFSQQTGLQLLMPPDGTGTAVAPRVIGHYTPEDALHRLLQGSRFGYQFVSDQTVVIQSVQRDGRSRVPTSADDGRSVRIAAADRPSATVTATDNPDDEALGEIVVSATRREEKSFTVPISLTALSQKSLDDYHVQSISDLATVVPGLVLTTVGGVSQATGDIAIRGVASNGNSPTTGIYIDETSIATRRIDVAGWSGPPRPDIFDLDRVEVLRGPQGTLFGAGAMGGVVRYITPRPNLSEESGFAKAEIGSTDQGGTSYVAGAAFGSPIVRDQLGFRVSGWFRSEGGFINRENIWSGQTVDNANAAHSYILRPAMTWQPVEGLTITPALYWQYRHTDDSDDYWINPPIPGQAADKRTRGAVIPSPFTDDLRIYSTAIKYSTRHVIFQSNTSYLQRKSHNTDDWTALLPEFFGISPFQYPQFAANSFFDQDWTRTQSIQQEFRVQSVDADARLSWVSGLYFSREKTLIGEVVSDADPIGLAAYGDTITDLFGVPNYVYNGHAYSYFTQFQTLDEQAALFGELTLRFTSHLKGNLGVRVEHAAVKEQRQEFGGPIAGPVYSSIAAPDKTENPVTPRAGLSYQFNDQAMVYASAGKGYRLGGSNAAAVINNPLCQLDTAAFGGKLPDTYNSDHLWSYELGVKWAPDPRLSVEASAFYVDWSNIQVTVGLPDCGNSVTANLGKAVTQGFDLQIATSPISGLKISANVGYTDAYYPNATTGVPDSNGNPTYLNAAGEKLPLIPPVTASFHTDYSRPVSVFGNETRLYGRLDYRWTDRLRNNDPRDQSYNPAIGSTLSDSYGFLNLRAGIQFAGLDISGYVDNLTNSNPTLSYVNFKGTDFFGAVELRPRTLGATILYHF